MLHLIEHWTAIHLRALSLLFQYVDWTILTGKISSLESLDNHVCSRCPKNFSIIRNVSNFGCVCVQWTILVLKCVGLCVMCNQNYKLMPWINEMVWGFWKQNQQIENSNGDILHDAWMTLSVTWELWILKRKKCRWLFIIMINTLLYCTSCQPSIHQISSKYSLFLKVRTTVS